MERKIEWEKDLNRAMTHAHAENKQILLFFHNPS
jgi:hypothetical protein